MSAVASRSPRLYTLYRASAWKPILWLGWMVRSPYRSLRGWETGSILKVWLSVKRIISHRMGAWSGPATVLVQDVGEVVGHLVGLAQPVDPGAPLVAGIDPGRGAGARVVGGKRLLIQAPDLDEPHPGLDHVLIGGDVPAAVGGVDAGDPALDVDAHLDLAPDARIVHGLLHEEPAHSRDPLVDHALVVVGQPAARPGGHREQAAHRDRHQEAGMEVGPDALGSDLADEVDEARRVLVQHPRHAGEGLANTGEPGVRDR